MWLTSPCSKDLGQTLGKAVSSIEVIREEDRGAPGPGRSALRALVFLFADMILSLFVMLGFAEAPEARRHGRGHPGGPQEKGLAEPSPLQGGKGRAGVPAGITEPGRRGYKRLPTAELVGPDARADQTLDKV